MNAPSSLPFEGAGEKRSIVRRRLAEVGTTPTHIARPPSRRQTLAAVQARGDTRTITPASAFLRPRRRPSRRAGFQHSPPSLTLPYIPLPPLVPQANADLLAAQKRMADELARLQEIDKKDTASSLEA